MNSKTDLLFDNLIAIDDLLVLLNHRVSKYTIYRWIQEGLPAIKVGKFWMLKKSDVARWLERKS